MHEHKYFIYRKQAKKWGGSGTGSVTGNIFFFTPKQKKRQKNKTSPDVTSMIASPAAADRCTTHSVNSQVTSS